MTSENRETDIDAKLNHTDSFFKRLFKNSAYYYEQGIIICGNYYGKVMNALFKKYDTLKNKYLRQIANGNIRINDLKKEYQKIKHQQEQSNVQRDCSVDEDSIDTIIECFNEIQYEKSVVVKLLDETIGEIELEIEK